jgi:hypothetical protein
MGTRRRLATLALLLALASGLAAVAGAETVQSGDLRVAFAADFSPKKLPRDSPAPITVEVEGKISTVDGSHPPPLQRLRIELNSAGKIDPTGIPICAAPLLQSTSTAAARASCGRAQVGSGTFEAQLELGGKPYPVDGRALVFNTRIGGRPGMLIHIYIASPVRLALVIPLKITRGQGEFGTVLSARVPELAAGFGSITELALKIGRTVGSGAARHGYLSAACAAPEGFPGATFTFARGRFAFGGGHSLHTALVRSCEVRNQ